MLGGWLAGWLMEWLIGWLAGWQARKTSNVIVSQKCINLLAKTHRFEHISCPSYTLAGQLAGWLAGCQQCIWDTKMRQKRVPLARKCVENAYP